MTAMTEMTEMKPNVDLLDDCAAWVRAQVAATCEFDEDWTQDQRDDLIDLTMRLVTEAGDWDQDLWCGTPCCVAGYAATVATPGARIAYARDGRLVAQHDDDPGDINHSHRIPTVTVDQRAMRLLGIGWEAANVLFAEGNTAADVLAAIDAIKAGTLT